MYQFKPITPRIARMRDKVRDRVVIADAGKARIKKQAEAKYKDFTGT